jgi:hypothetical protein
MHKKIILNAQTGEIIEREMTAPEEAEHLELIATSEARTEARAEALELQKPLHGKPY